jgi:hypothetical protein
MEGSVRMRARSLVQTACLVVLLSALSPSTAEAGLWCWLFGDCGGGGSTTAGSQSSPENSAPEIDPGALAGAIALAAGGAALFGGRVRRRR